VEFTKVTQPVANDVDYVPAFMVGAEATLGLAA